MARSSIEQCGLASAVKIWTSPAAPIFQEHKILSFLVRAAIRLPKLAIAVALAVLTVLAGTMTYTGFLVVGVVADYLGTGRFLAGLLLAVLFARFPSISNGKFRTVGLLPKPVRQPMIMSLLALCLFSFLSREQYVAATFICFAAAFVLTLPWMRRALYGRVLASIFKPPAHPSRPQSPDGMVIDGEFREKKD